MNMQSSELDEFYRYFRIGGMDHCGGGDGASAIGNVLAGVSGYDAEDNVLVRMVEWVEKGQEYAPEFVRGTKFVNVSFCVFLIIFAVIVTKMRLRLSNNANRM
jgi:feruloyl esterase